MKVKSINADQLKSMFISASNNLVNYANEIDMLNVFPVPDGDTGTNMNLTLQSGVKELEKAGRFNTAYDCAKCFSRGLLLGARGNSGVISSQIFRGFAAGMLNEKVITAKVLINALREAKNMAYKAVIKPVEGTILTVVRESSDYVEEHFNKNSDIIDIFKALCDTAKSALARTPDLLPVLKEAGVVDSGGAGYVKILEGLNSALNGKVIERTMPTEEKTASTARAIASIESDEFGYCTVFTLRLGGEGKRPFNEKRFASTLLSKGSSLELVHDEDIVKVHVHVLNPGWALNYAQEFGEFSEIRIENMTDEHDELVKLHKDPQTMHKEETSHEPMKEYALISCCAGDGIEQLFKDVGVAHVVKGGQTMNPSTEDFVEAIKKVHARNVFILPNNSNIIMAASQACEVIDENINARVIPSSSIPQGLVACMEFNPDVSIEENFRNMKSVLKNVKSASVTYAVRDTEINGVKVQKDNYMALYGKKILACVPDKLAALSIVLNDMVDEDSGVITIICGEDISEEVIEDLENKLTEKYADCDIDIQKGNQPVYSFIIGVE